MKYLLRFSMLDTGENLTVAVQADGTNMEEEIMMAEMEQGDTTNNESSVDMSNNSPTKRGRGRPQGSKKLKVCVTDVSLMELVSGISNGGSTPPQRKRGRPKLSGNKHTEQQESGDNNADSPVQSPQGQGRPKGSKKQGIAEDSPMTDHSPKKRGRPKKSLSNSNPEKADAEDLPNGGSDTPKMGRGRPKGSKKRKSESLTIGEENEGSPVIPRKRGRPKGSLNNTPKLEKAVSSQGQANGRGRPRKVVNNTGGATQDTSNGTSKMPRRGSGRPRKIIEQDSGDKQLVRDGSQPVKRGRGRPKGSLNKKPRTHTRSVYVLSTQGKPGRPKKQPAKRGRPKKYPLPSPEELKKPKVWKPLGRPRKYPRVDPPDGAPTAPRRRRGRPCKSESKKGAHLRKGLPTTSSSPHNPSDGCLRKRGRPPTLKSEGNAPLKRGRPKSSVNKNEARKGPQLDSTLLNDLKGDSAAFGVECEGEPMKPAPETNMPIEHRSGTEETHDQDASFEVTMLDEQSRSDQKVAV